jgi:glycosyltransferase involved in cell wall biosynthesis
MNGLERTDSDGVLPDPESPRVAFLLSDPGIPLYSSTRAGGVHARSMIRAFVQEGARVDVHALRTGAPVVDAHPHATVHKIRRGSLRRRFYQRYARRRRPPLVAVAEDLLAQRDFLRSVRGAIESGERPDLFYARHTWLAFSLSRVTQETGIPLYLEVNALFTLEKAKRGELALPALTRRIENRVLNSAAKVLPVSKSLAMEIEALGVHPERLWLTPNAVDLELFDADLRNHREGGPFRIGLLSGFRRYHGIGTLLRAAALLRGRIGDFRVTLIGDGPMRGRANETVQHLGMQDVVEMPGEVPHHEVPAWLAQFDVALAPFEGDHNQYNCPMKLFEYMAMKVPIIASNWGEIPNLLEDGRTALLHEPARPEALAARIMEVWENRSAAEERAEAAFEQVATNTWRSHARRILDDVRERKGSSR